MNEKNIISLSKKEDDEKNCSNIIEEKITKDQKIIELKKYKIGKLLFNKDLDRKIYEFICLNTNKKFAVKMIPKKRLNPREKKKILTLLKIIGSLDHPNIIKYDNYFEDDNNIYIFLDSINDICFNDYLKNEINVGEIEIKNYILQIIKGLQYLHNNKIIHRNLKLDNIYLTNNKELKIGDFDLAVKLNFDGEKRKSIKGTPLYMAPELLSEKEYSYEIDIWSLGIIIYTILIGKTPFETQNFCELLDKVKRMDYTFPKNKKISDDAKDLISKILVEDPSKRLTLDQILEHKFFKKEQL